MEKILNTFKGIDVKQQDLTTLLPTWEGLPDKKNNKKNGNIWGQEFPFVYLLSCCTYHPIATIVFCRFEKNP